MFEILKNVDWTDVESVKDGFASVEFIPMLVSLIACVALAFFAFKFYRICITAATAYGFGALGFWLGGILVEEFGIEIADIALEPVVALVLTLVGAIIGICLPRIATFLVGAGVGYSAGTIAASYLGANGAGVEFFDGTAGEIIVAVVCALIVAFLLFFFFKFIYILLTSVVSMAAAGALLGFIVYPEFVLYFLIGGAVVGIIAMIYQYKASEEI